MNSDNQGKLAVLLREALKSVTITHSGPDPIHPNVYRQMVYRYRSTYDPAIRFQAHLYDIQVKDPNVRRAILSLLRDELKPFLRDDKTFSASFAIVGGLSSGSSVEGILDNLMKSSVVFGPDQSASKFYGSIKRESITYQEYSLLTGIRTEQEM